MPQKQVNIPNIEIENIKKEFADEYNFLGITIHKHLKWDSHINKIASKILNIIGIMYRLKHMVPSEIILPYIMGWLNHIYFMVLGFQPGKNFKITEESHANYMFEWLPLSQRGPL